jgi:uncharacterized protein YqjF (DUF2071 family)
VAGDFDYTTLEVQAHRPWAMPTRPWLMTQTWHDLLFAHWPMEPEDLRFKVPAAFELDLFDGVAWIGIVPFYMSNVGFRGLPTLPKVSEFPELNVRTYIRVGGRPGVYFFSLDAASAPAVRAARMLLNLPYFAASMSVSRHSSTTKYESRRNADPVAEFCGNYEPVGSAFTPQKGSLEHFLSERYCLHHVRRRGQPYRIDIHHSPWLLQPAQADIRRNGMAAAAGLTLPDCAPLLHFAKRQDTVVWSPEEIVR